ncbi:hypothetical protein IAU60_002495 [Kwoniella sp. DSM 27419]
MSRTAVQEIELAPLPSAAEVLGSHSASSSQKDLNLSFGPAGDRDFSQLESSPTTPRAEDSTGPHDAIEALPPVDGGRRAWLFLVGATYIEVIVWGLPFSIGILHAYWTSTVLAGQNESIITLAATLQTGLLYMLAALFGPLFTAFPRWTKVIQIAGLMCASFAMIASAFVTKPWHLLVTVGLFYPLACACYLPCATLLFEWFYAKRGYATGIMYAGTGLGGTIFPFLMQGLLRRFGYKAAMISLGIGYLVTGLIALLPIQRRVPLSRYDVSGTGRQRARVDWSFLKRKTLVIGTSVILLTSLGNFIPSLWLPSYADDLKLRHPDGTSLIAIMNASSVIGNGLLGWLSDRFSLKSTILLSCFGSALSCAFLWGFAGPNNSEGVLIAFSVVFGLLGPSFSSLWSKMIGLVAGDDHAVSALVWSLFTFMRGCGNMSSGPVSDALLKYDVLQGGFGGYGYRNYGVLLIYTAVTITAGSAAGMLYKEGKPGSTRRS